MQNPYVPALLDLGVVVLPGQDDLASAPKVNWRSYQDDPPSRTKQERWLADTLQAWVLCGQVSHLVVVDCDDQTTTDWWLRNWPELADTFQVVTPRGRHFYLRCDADFPSWSVHSADLSFDVRANGGGVMGPGSVHPSGQTRDADRPLSPETLRGPSVALLGYLSQGGGGGQESAREGQGEATGRKPGGSRLTELLQSPPEAGGRNVWLTSVAGHLAKRELYRDAWEAQVQSVNAGLAEPLDQREVDKITRSVWSSERGKDAVATAQSGWLRGDRQRLWVSQKDRKTGDEYEAQWADFDPEVLGVVHTETGEVDHWLVRLHRSAAPTLETVLRADDLSNTNRLNRWCVRHQAYIDNAPGQGGQLSRDTRLGRYLQSQDAPELQFVSTLGWQTDLGFVTPTHVLTAQEATPLHEAGVSFTVKDVPFRYGFAGTEAEALDVLDEVLSFHEPLVTSLFGSWWVAALLKGQILSRVSQFPLVVLSAASESGKSTGFFSLLVQLGGSVLRHGTYTPASLRDLMSLNRSGVVWLDDVTDLGPQRLEFLRQATVEGEVTKKGGRDFADSVTVRLVAPVVVTGEGFEVVQHEKAMADRVFTFEVGSPVGRRSRHGDYPQWDDVVALQERYPDGLQDLAGTLVQLVLREGEPRLVELSKLRLGSGRTADKWAVVRLGARVLAELTGDEGHVARVDAWCVDQVKAGESQAHYLVTRVLPQWVIAHSGFIPEEPTPMLAGWTRDGHLYVSLVKLARWWTQDTRDERELQLGAENALRGQAEALGLTPKKYKSSPKVQGERNSRYELRAYELTRELTEQVFSLADEGTPGVPHRVSPPTGAFDAMLPFEQSSHGE